MFKFTEILREYARVVEIIDNALVSGNYGQTSVDIQKMLLKEYTVSYSPDNNEISIIGTHDYDFNFDIKKYEDIHRVSEAVTVNLYEESGMELATYVPIEELEEVINEHNCRYRFIKVSDLAEAIIRRYNNEDELKKASPIDFTFDTPQSIGYVGEPTCWCGVQIITVFDNDMAVFGCYGMDNGFGIALYNMMNINDLTTDMVFMFNRCALGDCDNVTKDTIICVDKNTL